jgi:2-methylcitrate dehydratase
MTVSADVSELDSVTAPLVDYCISPAAAEPSPDASHAVVRCILDGLGCALAGYGSTLGTAVRDIAASAHSSSGASVIGVASRTTLEYAAFANTTMLRYIDMNDTYPGKGGGHPSDMIPAVLAVAEEQGLSGRNTVAAIHVAYEVFSSLGDMIPLYDYGWDPGTFLQVGAAAGTAVVLRLDAAQTRNALAMAITCTMPMAVTRFGELSNWKACATAYAAMAGVFASRLAQRGITGPPRPFDGRKGFFDQVQCNPFRPNSPGVNKYDRTAAQRSSFKLYPCDFEVQIPAAVFCGLHAEGVRPEDVCRVAVATYDLAWRLNGGGNGDHDEKWAPRVRETADHSMPFVIAVALRDGTVDENSYRPEALADTALRRFMAKIDVEHEPTFDGSWLTAPAYRIVVEFSNGGRREFRVDRPHGHWLDPLSDAEVQGKYLRNAGKSLAAPRAEELGERVWALPNMHDVRELGDFLRHVD